MRHGHRQAVTGADTPACAAGSHAGHPQAQDDSAPPDPKDCRVFGAVRLGDGRFLAAREPLRFNAETFRHFMQSLWRIAGRSRRELVVILDNVT
jgi:hypothetical protein